MSVRIPPPYAATVLDKNQRFEKWWYDFLKDKDVTSALTEALSSGKIWIGDASNLPAEQTVSGDATLSTSGVMTIANDAVTFAKMQNITSDRLIGRDTAASGDPEEISLNATLEFTGTASIQRAALTGDVTATAGSNATTLVATSAVVEIIQDNIGGILLDSSRIDFTYNDVTPSITADIITDSVDNTFLANMAQSTIKGRAAAAGTGDPTDLTAAQVATIVNASLDHGTLLGLSDDDHTQYILASGTRALSADWDAGSFEIRAQTFESDVVTGTAPMVIASTTKVTNLNADLLDDQSGAYYLDSANFTGTNWTDLTDGGTTTLHTHTSGVASSITVAAESVDTSCSIVFVTAPSGDLPPKSSTGLTFNSATATLTATAFSGPLTGNVTGDVSGSAATVTGAAQAAITSVGTLTALQVDNININGNTISSTAGTDLLITPLAGQQIVLDGTIEVDAGVVTGATSITSTTFIGALTGNASTATALQNSRTIGGTAFDGTANIVPSTITIANEATDTSCSIAFFTAATGDLQPKTNANLTFNSNTGVLTSASAILTTADINGGTVDNAAIGGSTASTGAFTTISASGQITSTVATGSAPLVIASTTKVTNLNADLLDDQTGSYYLDSANFTGTNWTDLTDGGSTTLHIHAATSITNFHALIAAHASMRT